MTPPPALLVVGHGTCDEAGADAFRSFVHLLGERLPGAPVCGGFAHSPSPSLTDAVTELVEKHEARRIAVIPLLLDRAEHGEEAVREALEREEARYAGTRYADVDYALWNGPLGPHPALLDVLERRLDGVTDDGRRLPSDRAATTVLLVGRGSTDPEANAELFRVARLLWEGRGYAGVETAFVTRTAPDVPAGLERCARLTGGGRPVVVLPYFLFDGPLTHRLRQQAEGWAEAAGADVRFAPVLGCSAELADLVAERYGALPPGDDGR